MKERGKEEREMPRLKSKILSTDTVVALLQSLQSEETYQIINTTMK